MTLPNSGIPLGEWSGSDATDQLREAIVEMNAASARQTRTMIWLTGALVVLTVVMTLGIALDLWLALDAD
jgi:predicted nucleic acid-binding Zn ribbon protein